MDTTTLTEADVRAGIVLGLDTSSDAGNTNEASIVTTNATATWNTAKTVLTITLDEATDGAYIPDNYYVGASPDGSTVTDAVGNLAPITEIYSAQVSKETDAPTLSSVVAPKPGNG